MKLTLKKEVQDSLSQQGFKVLMLFLKKKGVPIVFNENRIPVFDNKKYVIKVAYCESTKTFTYKWGKK